MNESEKARDPKDMTASEMLRKAGNGYEGASGTVMVNLIDLMGLSRNIRHSECFYALADKIDAELVQARKDGFADFKLADWYYSADANDWPKPRDNESLHEYISRCFLPRTRFEDGEPAQFVDCCHGGVIESITVCSNGRWSLVNIAGELIDCGSSEQEVRRPAPEALGADGMPIVEGETVYPIDGEWLGTPLEVLGIESLSVKVSLPGGKGWTMFGADRLTHEEPDTQERIDRDAKEDPCAYFGRFICEGCHASENERSCDEIMILDLLRRQRELDARKGVE